MFLNLVRSLSKIPSSLPSSYFEIFSITPSFQLNLAELSTKYRALQAEYHPDRHVNSPQAEQELAATHSAKINEAYKSLKNPYLRARILLKNDKFDPNVRTMDMEFLSDMMDINDHVELCEDLETLNLLIAQNEEAITELYAQFEYHFNHKEHKTAAERLAKVKFLLQTRDRIEQQSEILLGS